jgi:hypothetical protein
LQDKCKFVSDLDAEIIRAADARDDAALAAGARAGYIPPGVARTSTGQVMRALIEYRGWVEQLLQRQRQLELLADRIDSYIGRVVPWPRMLIAVWISVLAVFICGVALPMLRPATSTIVAAWVPVIFYAAGLLLLGAMVGRRSRWALPVEKRAS